MTRIPPPMRNEDYFIIFLEEWLRLPGLSEYDRMRPAYLLKSARKNRPGMKAADFTYTDNDGKKRTLHATRGGNIFCSFFMILPASTVRRYWQNYMKIHCSQT